MEPLPPEDNSIWPPVKRFLYILPYAFILYVLSTGPMYWQIYDAYLMQGSTVIRVIYYPLVLACEIPFVNRFFNWYLFFWI